MSELRSKGCLSCSYLSPGRVHKFCEGCFQRNRAADRIERLEAALEKLRAFTKGDPDTTSTRFVLHVISEALGGDDE